MEPIDEVKKAFRGFDMSSPYSIYVPIMDIIQSAMRLRDTQVVGQAVTVYNEIEELYSMIEAVVVEDDTEEMIAKQSKKEESNV